MRSLNRTHLSILCGPGGSSGRAPVSAVGGGISKSGADAVREREELIGRVRWYAGSGAHSVFESCSVDPGPVTLLPEPVTTRVK